MTLHFLALFLHVAALGISVRAFFHYRDPLSTLLVALFLVLPLPSVLVIAGNAPVPVLSGFPTVVVGLLSLLVAMGLSRMRDERLIRAAEAVRKSEARFAKVFHASPDAVTLSTYADGRFYEVNEGFFDVTGYRPEEVIGQTSGDLQLWTETRDRDRLLEELRDQGRVRHMETVFRHKSGQERPCQGSAEVLEIEGETFLLFVVHDLSARKRVEAERQAVIAELEAKNEELERFVYTVSHDLKSPLVTIQGFLGFLEKDLEAGNLERAARDLSRIRKGSETMRELLDDLLELSRVGRVARPPTRVSMEELARKAVEQVSGPLRQVGAEVVVADDLPPAMGDGPRLQEVFQNLVENAGKFMGEQTAPWIEVGWRRDGEETVYFVADNGIGIDPSFQDKVFDLFERLDPAVPGTGIGLALVRRIIEVHGGRIWVESEGEGAGTRLCFTLGEPPAQK